MAERDSLILWLNSVLKPEQYPDYGPMGLQFTGAKEVTKVLGAVSISKDVINRAIEEDAQMIIVHHGLWWNNESRILDKRTQGRIDLLSIANISVLGYHLCLDAHKWYGNNRLLAKACCAKPFNVRAEAFGDIGWGVKIDDIGIEELKNRVSLFAEVDRSALTVFPYGPDKIQRVACITGGAPQFLSQAHREGYDAFVTGEAAEFTYYQAKELEMHFIAAGHHATERAGVRKIMSILPDMGVETIWHETPNPI